MSFLGRIIESIVSKNIIFLLTFSLLNLGYWWVGVDTSYTWREKELIRMKYPSKEPNNIKNVQISSSPYIILWIQLF